MMIGNMMLLEMNDVENNIFLDWIYVRTDNVHTYR